MTTLSQAELEAKLGQLGLQTPIPQFLAAKVLERPLDIFRSYLGEIVRCIVQVDPEHAYNAVQLPTSVDPFTGDFTIILPKLAKDAGVDIETLKESILKQFPHPNPLFGQPIPDGKQLRIFVHNQALAEIVLPYVRDRGAAYASAVPEPEETKPKVVIEFSSPNLVTELNGKHFRSTILGAQLVNLYKAQGWDVVKLNYLGDWGKPMGLLGVGFERFGSNELLASDTIHHLRDVYKKISDLFAPELASSKKARDDEKAREETGDSAAIESKGIYAARNAFFGRLESGDDTAIALWERFRDACIQQYIMLYGRLNIEFDDYSGESQVKAETMNDIEAELRAKGICEESEQSLVIQLQQHGSKHGTAIIRDRTGSSTYLLRELAATIERFEQYNFDKMVYVVAGDQHIPHFHKLTRILELLGKGELAGKLQHVSFNEASYMPEPFDSDFSLDQMLKQCEDALANSLSTHPKEAEAISTGPDAATQLTAAACFAQASSVKRAAELKFAVDAMASFESGSVTYLLNWLARLSTATRSSEESSGETEHSVDYLDDFENAVLLRWLAHLPEVTQTAFKSSEPATIMGFVNTVTSILTDCFDDEDTISATSPAHLDFLHAVRVVLANALTMLGISEVRVKESVDHARDSAVYI